MRYRNCRNTRDMSATVETLRLFAAGEDEENGEDEEDYLPFDDEADEAADLEANLLLQRSCSQDAQRAAPVQPFTEPFHRGSGQGGCRCSIWIATSAKVGSTQWQQKER